LPIAADAALHSEPQTARDGADGPVVIAGLDLVEQQATHAGLLGFVEPFLAEALDGDEGALVGDVVAQVGEIDAAGAGLDDEGAGVSGFKLRTGEDHGRV
jgi:hypothetical protein